MSWADSPTAITALRTLVKDNPQDKLCSTKEVIGERNGSNKIFKTFEYRRLTDFSSTGLSFPLGLYLNGTMMSSTGVGQDDMASGAFSLVNAPADTDTLRATYYYQWFTDPELDNFLQNASTWLGFGPSYIGIPDGLNAACLRFAAQEAYLAASMKYATRMSEVYKLEDAPSEEIVKALDAFKSMANDFMKSAETLRDDYYKRQGQPNAPVFGFALGHIRDPQPRR